MKKYQYLISLCVFLLSSCNVAQIISVRQEGAAVQSGEPLPIVSNEPVDLEMQAQEALIDYYQSLNQGMYDRAVALFGGSYEELEYFNPLIDPDDKPELLRAGCEFNGFMCLQILSSVLVRVENQNEFFFDVEFANPDGSLFVLGPCCGATEETMPPMSVFTVQVSCENGGPCQVMNLPPYVP